MRDAKIEIVAYDPTWPARFEVERVLLEWTLGRWLAGSIEHIGSTAVPMLDAKPVIDIMAPVHSLESSHPAIATARDAGYQYFAYKPEAMHWFCKPSPELRTHHLHLIPVASELWGERLRFRDALRNDPLLAAEYAELKNTLARLFPEDRDGYTDAKSAFVHRVLSQTR